MIFCVFGFANFLKFEAVTKIYIKDTIYVKCQVTNYDVWFNLMDTIRLFRILVLSLHRSSGVGITLLKNKDPYSSSSPTQLNFIHFP